MGFSYSFFINIFNFHIVCFLLGVFLSVLKPGFRISRKMSKWLTIYILFCIGLKGGGPLVSHAISSGELFFMILSPLVIWGLLSPFLSFCLLRSFASVDSITAAAIAACFGSVSVMTFITAIAFLDQMQIHYREFMIAVLPILEFPAIISGIFLAKRFKRDSFTVGRLFRESIMNKVVVTIFIGLVFGVILYTIQLDQISEKILYSFKPFLCLFLFDMGLNIGLQREHFRSLSWSLNLFGFYMPLIGGGFGLLLSYLLQLDVGTATLIAVLSASASYIAAPAAMRMVAPHAKEAIYLPLSLGIAFPFNVIIGIPLYYYLASVTLK